MMYRKISTAPSAQIRIFPGAQPIPACGNLDLRLPANDQYEQSRRAHALVIATLAELHLQLDALRSMPAIGEIDATKIAEIRQDFELLQNLADRLYEMAVPAKGGK